MLPHAEVRRLLDQRLVVRDPQLVTGELAGRQRDEGVPPEDARPDGRPLGLAGRVVQVHLVDGADLVAVAVDGPVPDEVAGVDVGLHSVPPVRCSCGTPAGVGLEGSAHPPLHTKSHEPDGCERSAAVRATRSAVRGDRNRGVRGQGPVSRPAPAGTLGATAEPARESPRPHETRGGGAEGATPPRNLSGIRTVWDRSLWKAGQDRRRGSRRPPPSPTVQADGVPSRPRAGEALRSR